MSQQIATVLKSHERACAINRHQKNLAGDFDPTGLIVHDQVAIAPRSVLQRSRWLFHNKTFHHRFVCNWILAATLAVDAPYRLRADKLPFACSVLRYRLFRTSDVDQFLHVLSVRASLRGQSPEHIQFRNSKRQENLKSRCPCCAVDWTKTPWPRLRTPTRCRTIVPTCP